MDKYWKQKEKERLRNKELEKNHGLHWQHKHFKPSDILKSHKSRLIEANKMKHPELLTKGNRYLDISYLKVNT
jgi:hypothetical protein